MATPATPAQQQSFRVEVLDKMTVLITTAFGLVAALAWNEAIQAVFTEYLGADRSALAAKLGYAAVVTVVAVVLVIYIGKLASKAKQRVARPRA